MKGKIDKMTHIKTLLNKKSAHQVDWLLIFFSVKIFSKFVKKIMTVTATEIKSAIGSATNTPNTLFVKKSGKIKINGINKMIFRNKAKNSDFRA